MSENEIEQQTTEKKDTDLSIGERIQKKRKSLGLSVEDLAFLTATFDHEKSSPSEKGLSSQTLYRYEKNEREPATREIRLLCRAINVSADWLIFGQVWNAEQEADTTLASNFRALVKDAMDDKTINLLRNKNKSRDDWHQIKLLDVKSRIK